MADEKEPGTDLLTLLRTEYGQIQSKIDKIGEFRFKVRGWALTILSGFGIGIFTYDVPWYSVFILLSIIGVFHYLEREQYLLETRLERRVSDIETAIRRSDAPFTENEEKKRILDKRIAEIIGYTPRYGTLMGSSRRDRESSFFSPKAKENRLYFLIYILTIILFAFKFISPSPKENTERDISNVDIRIDNTEETLITKPMKSSSQVDKIEEEMYSLISQINYGDISDIDLYWESLGNSLLKLKVDDWKAKPKHRIKVSAIIKTMTFVKVGSLVEKIDTIEKLTKKASNSSDENIEELKDLAVDFEANFEKLIIELRKHEK